MVISKKVKNGIYDIWVVDDVCNCISSWCSGRCAWSNWTRVMFNKDTNSVKMIAGNVLSQGDKLEVRKQLS